MIFVHLIFVVLHLSKTAVLLKYLEAVCSPERRGQFHCTSLNLYPNFTSWYRCWFPEFVISPSDATDWHQLRRTLNPGLLKQKEVAAFAPTVHQVVGDLLKRIEFLRSCSQDQATVSNIASELYKFGFEGKSLSKQTKKKQEIERILFYLKTFFNCCLSLATSAILFETRLGCLEQNIPKDTMRFITAVNDMLTLSQLIVLFPRWSWSVLPIWKRFVKAWDDLYDVGKQQKKEEKWKMV